MSDLLEYLVGQKRCEGSRTLGATAWAETPLLAAYRHEELVTAICAPDTSKTRLESAAVKIGVDDIIDEGSPEAVALFEALLPDALDLTVRCLDQAIQGRLLWLAGTIEADGTFCDQGKLLPCRSVEGLFQGLSNPGKSQDANWPGVISGDFFWVLGGKAAIRSTEATASGSSCNSISGA